MAVHAILEVADALLEMLFANVCRGVLVTAVTGIAGGVVARMAGGAAGTVFADQREIAVMVEGGWFPRLRSVTLRTLGGDAAMHAGIRPLLAALAVGGLPKLGRPAVGERGGQQG